MFWKDIATWTGKKVKLYYLIFTIIYYVFSLLIPVVIVACNYDMVASGNRLSGIGIIVLLIVGVIGFRSLYKIFTKMPYHSYKKRVIKNACLGVSQLFLIGLLCFLVYLIKVNTETALNTIMWCLLSYTGSIIVDYTCLKFLEYEFEIDDKKDEQKEVNARMHR